MKWSCIPPSPPKKISVGVKFSDRVELSRLILTEAILSRWVKLCSRYNSALWYSVQPSLIEVAKYNSIKYSGIFSNSAVLTENYRVLSTTQLRLASTVLLLRWEVQVQVYIWVLLRWEVQVQLYYSGRKYKYSCITQVASTSTHTSIPHVGRRAKVKLRRRRFPGFLSLPLFTLLASFLFTVLRYNLKKPKLFSENIHDV